MDPFEKQNTHNRQPTGLILAENLRPKRLFLPSISRTQAGEIAQALDMPFDEELVDDLLTSMLGSNPPNLKEVLLGREIYGDFDVCITEGWTFREGRQTRFLECALINTVEGGPEAGIGITFRRELGTDCKRISAEISWDDDWLFREHYRVDRWDIIERLGQRFPSLKIPNRETELPSDSTSTQLESGGRVEYLGQEEKKPLPARDPNLQMRPELLDHILGYRKAYTSEQRCSFLMKRMMGDWVGTLDNKRMLVVSDIRDGWNRIAKKSPRDDDVYFLEYDGLVLPITNCTQRDALENAVTQLQKIRQDILARQPSEEFILPLAVEIDHTEMGEIHAVLESQRIPVPEHLVELIYNDFVENSHFKIPETDLDGQMPIGNLTIRRIERACLLEHHPAVVRKFFEFVADESDTKEITLYGVNAKQQCEYEVLAAQARDVMVFGPQSLDQDINEPGSASAEQASDSEGGYWDLQEKEEEDDGNLEEDGESPEFASLEITYKEEENTWEGDEADKGSNADVCKIESVPECAKANWVQMRVDWLTNDLVLSPHLISERWKQLRDIGISVGENQWPTNLMYFFKHPDSPDLEVGTSRLKFDIYPYPPRRPLGKKLGAD